MIKEGSFWDVENVPTGVIYPGTGDRYRISGDTLINNITYKKLQMAPIRTSNENLLLITNEWYINANEFVDLKHIFLREDVQEKKVYIYVDHNVFSPYEDYEEIKKEYTYCDFNLNIGGEMVNAFVDSNYPYKLKVKNIYQSTFYNKSTYDLGAFGTYIEGIGKINFPFEPYSFHPLAQGDVSSEIHCFGNKENQNGCTAVLNSKTFNLPKIKFYPNPVNNFLFIENKRETKVRIYTTTGKLLKNKSSSVDFKIDVAHLSKGVYFIKISNDLGKQTSKFLKI